MSSATTTDDAAERESRLTFVVVGAGYTGTDVAAQGVLLTEALVRKHPRLAGRRPFWLLVDTAARVLPGLGEKLAATADRVLRTRGVEIRRRTSVTEATSEGVHLSDGARVATRSLVWCVGVQPEALIEGLELPTTQGRLDVDEYLTVPRTPGAVRLRGCGGRPGSDPLRGDHRDDGPACPATGDPRRAQPVRFPLSGLPAKAVTRGYHRQPG